MGTIVRRANPEDMAYVLVHLPSLVKALCEYPRLEEAILPANYFVVGQVPLKLSLNNASQNSLCLIAEDANQIVGVLTCRGARYTEMRHVTTMEVFVAPDYRGQGIGSGLVESAISWARETEIVTRVDARVPITSRLIDFYQRFGFQVEATCGKAGFLNGELVDMVLMALLLEVTPIV